MVSEAVIGHNFGTLEDKWLNSHDQQNCHPVGIPVSLSAFKFKSPFKTTRLSLVSVACDLSIFFCYKILYCIVKLVMPRAISKKSGDASLSFLPRFVGAHLIRDLGFLGPSEAQPRFK